MSAGNIVHEMRQLFDRRRSNPRPIDLNTLTEQAVSLQAPDVRDKESQSIANARQLKLIWDLDRSGPFYDSDHDGLEIGQLLLVPLSFRTEEPLVTERRHPIVCGFSPNLPVRLSEN
jgi:hypothetical protein